MTIETKVWDAADHLKTQEDIVEYLDAALEDGDSAVIAIALGNVARAKGMTDVARESGLSRESLYKSLGEDGNPRLDTLMRVLKAVGVQLSARPAA